MTNSAKLAAYKAGARIWDLWDDAVAGWRKHVRPLLESTVEAITVRIGHAVSVIVFIAGWYFLYTLNAIWGLWLGWLPALIVAGLADAVVQALGTLTKRAPLMVAAAAVILYEAPIW
jgi:hypothetical protein